MGRGGDPVLQLDEEEKVSEEDRLREASGDDCHDGVVGRVVGGEGEVGGEVLFGCLQSCKNLDSCLLAPAAYVFVIIMVAVV